VKRSFTKTIKNLRFSTCKEHLVNLCLDSLQCRRVKADLVFCFKLIHGLVHANATKFFIRSSNTQLRGNQFKLVKPRSVFVRKVNFYSNRVVDIWNRSANSIVTAESVSSFKRRLNSFDFASFMSHLCIFLFREPVSIDCCQPWHPYLTFRTFIACFLQYVLLSH
jgi:hypothetical protein